MSISTPAADNALIDLNIEGETNGSLIFETTPIHQEALSAQNKITLEENKTLSNLALSMEDRDKNKKKKEKKKNKNKKGKGRNKKRKNKKGSTLR